MYAGENIVPGPFSDKEHMANGIIHWFTIMTYFPLSLN